MPKARSKPAASTTRRKSKPIKGATRAKTARKRKPQKPIELYFWPTSNGIKISIMLEECGLPYELKPVNINRGEQFGPHFLSISPNNRIPAILDPDGPCGKPVSLFESGAILQYYGRKTGEFYLQNARRRLHVNHGPRW